MKSPRLTIWREYTDYGPGHRRRNKLLETWEGPIQMWLIEVEVLTVHLAKRTMRVRACNHPELGSQSWDCSAEPFFEVYRLSKVVP